MSWVLFPLLDRGAFYRLFSAISRLIVFEIEQKGIAMDSVEDRVIKVVASVLKVDPEEVDTESRFTVELGAESIQSVELVAALEDEFDVEMDEDDALSVQTVGQAIDYIEKCLQEQC